jgi:hypothetical protein
MQPPSNLSPTAVKEALRDLQNRTLAGLDGDLARLVYLASTRDYNTGRYTHDGLSFRFSESVAQEALAAAHRGVFASLALSPLRVLVANLERYIRSGCAGPNELVTAWNTSEAYRILPPAADDPLTVKLFNSNIKVALAIVKAAFAELQPVPGPQCASQPPSPVR